MKGVFIFNSMNDVSYLWCDDSFHDYVKSRLEALGFDTDQDFSNPENTRSQTPFRFDPNLIMQAFSPLIASIKFMFSQVHNAYNSITFDDDFVFSFNQYDDDVYVAANGDGLETEDFLHRKLDVLHKIMTFMFGPVSDIMMSGSGQNRNDRVEKATLLLETWTRLQATEQCFLIEAIERLHVNQMLNMRSIELLEALIREMKSTTEKPIVHALIVVNSKLLALYSNTLSSDLYSADVLMIILLVNSVFKWCPLESESETSRDGNKQSDSSDQEYFSIPSSPPNVSEIDSTQVAEPGQSLTLSVVGLSKPTAHSTPKSKSSHGTAQSVKPQSKSGRDQSVIGAVPYTQNINPEILSNTPVYSSPENTREKRKAAHVEKVEKVIIPQTVTSFLRTPLCRYTPHTLQCVPVLHDTAIILITETAKPSNAAIVTHLLALFRSILKMADTPESYTNFRWGHQMTLIDTNVKKLQELGKTFKGVGSVERMLHDITRNWEMLKKNHGFTVTNIAELSPTAESSISHMQVKGLYYLLLIITYK